MGLDLYAQMQSIEETAASGRLNINAERFLEWLRDAVTGHSCKEHSEGPVIVVETLFYPDDKWPFDEVAEKDLLPGASYSVRALGPEACWVEASWALGREHEEFPVYLGVIERAIAMSGTETDAVSASWSLGAAFEQLSRYHTPIDARAGSGAGERTAPRGGVAAPAAPARRRGPTAETQRRAKLFLQIKTEHPEYSRARVAREATRRARARASASAEAPEYSAHNVRDAYKAMGWDWERGNLVR